MIGRPQPRMPHGRSLPRRSVVQNPQGIMSILAVLLLLAVIALIIGLATAAK